MLMRPVFRQGDVLLDQVDDLPAGADEAAVVAPDDGRVILAYGEATGHCHAVPATAGELLEVATAEHVDRYLRIRSRTRLTHQEHRAIDLEPGVYRVRIQSEYVPQMTVRRRRRPVVD
jgi:hypothetical protein